MSDDVLAAIDAAIAELCGCGCGEPLPPNGPSADYIDDVHQQRWMERQATNPGEVYASREGGGAVHREMEQPIQPREPLPPRRNTRWGWTRFYEEGSEEGGAVTFWVTKPATSVAARIAEWLEANGIERRLIPWAATIRVSAAEISFEQFVPDAGGRLRMGEDGEPLREARTVPLVVPLPPAPVSEPEQVGAVLQREFLGIWPPTVNAAGRASAGSGWTRCPRCGRNGMPGLGDYWETCPSCSYIYREPRFTAEIRRDDFDGSDWVRVRAALGRQKAVREARVTEAELDEPVAVDGPVAERARELRERLLESWHRNLPPVPEDVLEAERVGGVRSAMAAGRLFVAPADASLAGSVDVGAINNDRLRFDREDDQVDALAYAVRSVSSSMPFANVSAANFGHLFGIRVVVDPDLPPDTVRIVPRADDRTPPRIVVAPGSSPVTPEVEALVREEYEAMGARVRETMQRFAEAIAPQVAQMAAQVNEFLGRIQPVLQPEPPSATDVMQRAIEARRNRSTGPAERRRAPRRIDPTGGRG